MMFRRLAAVTVLGAGMVPATLVAQGVAIAPTIGAYVPAGSFSELERSGSASELKRGATLGVGLNIDLGALRGTFAYASGAQIDEEGDINNREDIGDGSVLVGTAALVLRPIPRILILQPYLLIGGGFKQLNYSFNDDAIAEAFPKDERDLTGHIGIGADLSIGRLALLVEVNDFISQNAQDKWDTHDAFGMVGLRLRLF